VPIDIDFVPGKNVGYVVSQASDEVLRVVWDFAANTTCVGSNVAKVINLQAAAGDFKVPIGIVVRNDGQQAYVNSWVGREIEVVDFPSQSVTARLPLSAQPTTDPEKTIQKGKKFFWTATGRWSKQGFGSCGACHPDGLSDGATWVFGVGPRQTLPLDAVYAKPNGTPDANDQRLLNWTAINDEIHDFENNTRGVSGGLGAIVSTSAGGTDTQIDLVATKDNLLSGSVKQLALDGTTPRALVGGGMGMVNTTTASDWDAIDLYVQTLRSTHRPSNLPAASVSRGATLFSQHGCANCHSGPKWTLSKRPYTPQQGAGVGSVTCALQTTTLAKKSVPNGGTVPQNLDVFQLELERSPAKSCVAATDCSATPGYACTTVNATSYCTVATQRVTCALRNVASFGSGPQGAGFEVRSDTDGAGTPLIAEGATGYNIPSLLSLATTAPYLHNGAAQTLVDLFSNAAFSGHTSSGDPNFSPSPSDAQDLANFLLSIDVAATAMTPNDNLDLCKNSFTANGAAVCNNP
jgi:cytochrome c peroxidase